MNPSLTEKPQGPRDNLGFRPKQPLAESLLVLIVTHSTRIPTSFRQRRRCIGTRPIIPISLSLPIDSPRSTI